VGLTDVVVAVLDPVMGDQGRLYVSEGVVPVYKSLLSHADMVVPNQFEAEYYLSTPSPLQSCTDNIRLLSGVKVDSIESLSRAIDEIHRIYKVPHVVVTSVTFTNGAEKMKCAGSSMTPSGVSRKFIFGVPIIDGFYSGTGDLFAALTLARLRQFSAEAGLLETKSWTPPEEVQALDLPLAKAIGVVLGSMHLVLEKTRDVRDRILASETGDVDAMGAHVRTTRASELRLVQCQKELVAPELAFKAVLLP